MFVAIGLGVRSLSTRQAERVRPKAERREETVCNSGTGSPDVHTPVWASLLCTGGRGIGDNLAKRISVDRSSYPQANQRGSF